MSSSSLSSSSGHRQCEAYNIDPDNYNRAVDLDKVERCPNDTTKNKRWCAVHYFNCEIMYDQYKAICPTYESMDIYKCVVGSREINNMNFEQIQVAIDDFNAKISVITDCLKKRHTMATYCIFETLQNRGHRIHEADLFKVSNICESLIIQLKNRMDVLVGKVYTKIDQVIDKIETTKTIVQRPRTRSSSSSASLSSLSSSSSSSSSSLSPRDKEINNNDDEEAFKLSMGKNKEELDDLNNFIASANIWITIKRLLMCYGFITHSDSGEDLFSLLKIKPIKYKKSISLFDFFTTIYQKYKNKNFSLIIKNSYLNMLNDHKIFDNLNQKMYKEGISKIGKHVQKLVTNFNLMMTSTDQRMSLDTKILIANEFRNFINTARIDLLRINQNNHVNFIVIDLINVSSYDDFMGDIIIQLSEICHYFGQLMDAQKMMNEIFDISKLLS